MIDAISTVSSADLLDTVRKITQDAQTMVARGTGSVTQVENNVGFDDMLSNLVQSVDGKQKAADTSVQAVLTGKTNNIHQAMLSMQEAGVAFTMMSEVRNKLVSAFQELIKMQV